MSSEKNLPPQTESEHAASITELLSSVKTIAVVGLSSKPFRPSHGVARYLLSLGYRVIPVNPQEPAVLGQKSYPRLTDIAEPVDLVDIFRRSDAVLEIVDDAIRIGARAVWMQEGVVNETAAVRARAAGLRVVMDHCIAKELHKRRK